LRVIETAAGVPHEEHFPRGLPPFFAPVGTKDPLLDDTRRLEKALAQLKVPCEARYYPGGIHAFHAMVWDPAARPTTTPGTRTFIIVRRCRTSQAPT